MGAAFLLPTLVAKVAAALIIVVSNHRVSDFPIDGVSQLPKIRKAPSIPSFHRPPC